MTALVTLNDVTKRFGGLQAVGHMTFSLNKGEILGLIGPNGAGKTTIFNLINGYYPPTGGTILFKGDRIDGLKPHKVCRLGLARTFQVVKPLARLSVLDNVMVSAFSRTNRRDEAEKTALEATAFTEMDAWRDVKAGHLIFFGVLIVAIIIYFPSGIVGAVLDWRARRRRPSPAVPAA